MIQNSFNYNDIGALNDIRKLGREDKDAALKMVAKQFESMFLKMMLKSMRDANKVFENPDFLGSNESQFYRNMLDEQMTLSLSEGKGIGLADSFYQQMRRDYIKGETNEDGSLNQDLDRYVPLSPYYKKDAILSDTPLETSSSDGGVSPNQQLIDQLNVKPNLVTDLEKPNKVTATLATSSRTKPGTEGIPNHIAVQKSDHSNDPIVKKKSFSSPLDFIKTLLPTAKKVAKALGIDPKAILAQGALETGWGKYIIHKGEQNSHNLFGIKADQRWDGEKVKVSTLEYRDNIPKKELANFRSYENYEHSLNDYLNFIQNSARYQQAIKDGKTVEGYAKGLQKGGYATDPQYAAKIVRIANSEIMKSSINLAMKESSEK